MQLTGLGNASRILLAFLSLSSIAHAQIGQILDRSKLPSCAFNCQLLTQAQSLCVPPTAPTADPAVYQTCFCNSNYVAPFRAGGTAGVCDAECLTPSDLTAIQQWFTGLCTGGVVVIPNNGAIVPGTATTTASTGTGTAASTSGGSAPNRSGGHKSWIDTHYRWVIMIIVLSIAAIAGIFIGLYFKRRYDRRHALGGHNRDSMLAADEAAQSLRDRHPSNIPMRGQNNMSQVQLPPMMSAVGRSGESLPSRGMTASSYGMRSDRLNRDVNRSTDTAVTSQPSDDSLGRSGSRLKKSLRRNQR